MHTLPTVCNVCTFDLSFLNHVLMHSTVNHVFYRRMNYPRHRGLLIPAQSTGCLLLEPVNYAQESRKLRDSLAEA
jgi:hypothetical protein